jgi:hypothetical protein
MNEVKDKEMKKVIKKWKKKIRNVLKKIEIYDRYWPVMQCLVCVVLVFLLNGVLCALFALYI